MLTLRVTFSSRLRPNDPSGPWSLDVSDVPTPEGKRLFVPKMEAHSHLAALGRFEALGGPIYLSFGPTPDPTVEPRHLVSPDQPLEMLCDVGDFIAAIAAKGVARPDA